jgi:hypothetical protein
VSEEQVATQVPETQACLAPQSEAVRQSTQVPYVPELGSHIGCAAGQSRPLRQPATHALCSQSSPILQSPSMVHAGWSGALHTPSMPASPLGPDGNRQLSPVAHSWSE